MAWFDLAGEEDRGSYREGPGGTQQETEEEEGTGACVRKTNDSGGETERAKQDGTLWRRERMYETQKGRHKVRERGSLLAPPASNLLNILLCMALGLERLYCLTDG